MFFRWIFAAPLEALASQVQSLTAQNQLLHTQLMDANARYERLYQELITGFKAEINWHASCSANRPVFGEVPLADTTVLPGAFRDRNGSPVPVNSRTGNARRKGRIDSNEFLNEFFKAQAEKLSHPETQAEMAASVPADMQDDRDALERLIEEMKRSQEQPQEAVTGGSL